MGQSSQKTLLTLPAVTSVKVEAQKTLLQITDMQDDFGNPNSPFYLPMFKSIVPNIKMLLDKARELDMVVIHTNSFAYPTPGERRWKSLRGSFNGWFGPEVDELKPLDRAREYVVPKTTHDPFFRTFMDKLLDTFPMIDTVIVTGVATNVCVMYSIAGYCIRGFRVIVPIDCVGASTEEMQIAALNVIKAICPAFPVTITTSYTLTLENYSF